MEKEQYKKGILNMGELFLKEVPMEHCPSFLEGIHETFAGLAQAFSGKSVIPEDFTIYEDFQVYNDFLKQILTFCPTSSRGDRVDQEYMALAGREHYRYNETIAHKVVRLYKPKG